MAAHVQSYFHYLGMVSFNVIGNTDASWSRRVKRSLASNCSSLEIGRTNVMGCSSFCWPKKKIHLCLSSKCTRNSFHFRPRKKRVLSNWLSLDGEAIYTSIDSDPILFIPSNNTLTDLQIEIDTSCKGFLFGITQIHLQTRRKKEENLWIWFKTEDNEETKEPGKSNSLNQKTYFEGEGTWSTVCGKANPTILAASSMLRSPLAYVE